MKKKGVFLRVFFSTFCIVVSAVSTKSEICFFLKIKLIIGYHSNFNPECKRERGFINQLYIELGYLPNLPFANCQ